MNKRIIIALLGILMVNLSGFAADSKGKDGKEETVPKLKTAKCRFRCVNPACTSPDEFHSERIKYYEGSNPIFSLIAPGCHEKLRSLLADNPIYISQINNASTDGWTPIMQAAFRGNLECVKILLLYKPKLELRNNQDQTVFEIAMRTFQEPMILTLWDAGAVPIMDDFQNNMLTASVFSFCPKVTERFLKNLTPDQIAVQLPDALERVKEFKDCDEDDLKERNMHFTLEECRVRLKIITGLLNAAKESLIADKVAKARAALIKPAIAPAAAAAAAAIPVESKDTGTAPAGMSAASLLPNANIPLSTLAALIKNMENDSARSMDAALQALVAKIDRGPSYADILAAKAALGLAGHYADHEEKIATLKAAKDRKERLFKARLKEAEADYRRHSAVGDLGEDESNLPSSQI